MTESPSESDSEAGGQEAPLSEALLPGSTNCDPCSLSRSLSETALLGRDISSFLELPQIHMQPRIQRTLEPLVDYSQSILLTSDNYLQSMAAKAQKREEAKQESI